MNWIIEVGRISFHDIRNELDNMDQLTLVEPVTSKPVIQVDTLPKDAINLFDSTQLEYYHDNVVVKRAIEFIKARRLDVAINRPSAFYVSLTDKVHHNRLIIPFADTGGKIAHYQSRTILKADEKNRPRYMSKQGSEKTLFNFDKINTNVDTIFVFEGPLNACFCVNGVAVAGIQENSERTFTNKQQDQINRMPFHSHVWVLDSQWMDTAALNKSKILAAAGESIFVWPEKIGRKLKDFNDLAIAGQIDQVSPDFILSNTYKGVSAEIRLRAM